MEIIQQLRSVTVELLELGDADYEPLVIAGGQQEFATTEPFGMRFTPRDLIP